MATVQDTEMFGSDSDADLAPQNIFAAKPVASDHDMEDDLFGDEAAPQKEHASSVPRTFTLSYATIQLISLGNRRETSPTPSALGDEDGLTLAERRARQALEYEEEDDAPPAVLREAEVPVPNIPMPHSSDGNVCLSPARTLQATNDSSRPAIALGCPYAQFCED